VKPRTLRIAADAQCTWEIECLRDTFALGISSGARAASRSSQSARRRPRPTAALPRAPRRARTHRRPGRTRRASDGKREEIRSTSPPPGRGHLRSDGLSIVEIRFPWPLHRRGIVLDRGAIGPFRPERRICRESNRFAAGATSSSAKSPGVQGTLPIARGWDVRKILVGYPQDTNFLRVPLWRKRLLLKVRAT